MRSPRLIWMAIEYSASPKDGGGVLECELRATDMQARQSLGGIHLLADPSTDDKHTQPNQDTTRRHRDDGLLKDCYEHGVDFKTVGIIRTAQWIDEQARQGELHPIGSGILDSIRVLGQYLAKPAAQLRSGCMDMRSVKAAMAEANPELLYEVQRGIPYPGTRTMTRLNTEIATFGRIMDEISGFA